MCDPSTALMAAGAAQKAVGAFFSTASQNSAAKYQAQIADINAQASDAAAERTLNQSSQEQSQILERGAQVKAKQIAGQAANGIDVGVGSAVNVQTSTDYVTEVDRQRAEASGISAAWGQKIQADNYRATGRTDIASTVGNSPLLAASNSLLGSSGAVAKNWYADQQAGGNTASNDNSGSGFSAGDSGDSDLAFNSMTGW